MSGKLVELTAETGYQRPEGEVAPALKSDRRVQRTPTGQMSMRARKLQVVSDGTLVGTTIYVDGQPLEGLVRFEMIAEKGKPLIRARVDTTYCYEDIDVYSEEFRGKDVLDKDGKPAVVSVEVFGRRK